MRSSVPGIDTLAIDAAGRPRQGFESLGRDRLPAADARAEGSRIEAGEGFIDQDQLLIGAVAQGQIALLGEDLAGRRGLRPVGHLPGRDDGLAKFLHEARPFDLEGLADGFAARCHDRMVRG